ncbi:50S ribosomal protein L6 [Candidatus Gracilibacteria bacterium]|nr:50S ribosomal protein L6 [Candidatus Gracilibacteria bacterium]
MSRLAKKPFTLPAGVTATLNGSTLLLQGAKGKLDYTLPASVEAKIEGNVITLNSTVTEGKQFAQWGLSWALIQSKVKGVSVGFQKSLEIQGVGYRVEVAGKKITLAVGFSHKVPMVIPDDVTVVQDAQNPSILIVSGVDAQRVGEVAGKIRAVKTPEPYKGKGIRYVDEYVRRKAGKTGAK